MTSRARIGLAIGLGGGFMLLLGAICAGSGAPKAGTRALTAVVEPVVPIVGRSPTGIVAGVAVAVGLVEPPEENVDAEPLRFGGSCRLDGYVEPDFTGSLPVLWGFGAGVERAGGLPVRRGVVEFHYVDADTALIYLGPGRDRAVLVTLQANPNGTVSCATIVPMESSESMAATVLGDDGVPLVRAVVEGCGDSTISDGAGRVSLQRYVEGDCTVRVRCDGYEDEPVWGPPTPFGASELVGPPTVDIEIQPPSRLRAAMGMFQADHDFDDAEDTDLDQETRSAIAMERVEEAVSLYAQSPCTPIDEVSFVRWDDL